MLTVYIDFKSPDAYLAMKPTLALAEQHKIAIDWRPFRVVERDVPQEGTSETVGQRHRRVRAAAQRALAVKYAKHQGIDLEFPPETGVTDLALGVLGDIEGSVLPFIQSAFAAYWNDHADLDDPDVVRQVITESGSVYSRPLETARLRLEHLQQDAEEAGIVGTPAYVISDQIFVGREHLPWIEELILGEVR